MISPAILIWLSPKITSMSRSVINQSQRVKIKEKTPFTPSQNELLYIKILEEKERLEFELINILREQRRVQQAIHNLRNASASNYSRNVNLSDNWINHCVLFCSGYLFKLCINFRTTGDNRWGGARPTGWDSKYTLPTRRRRMAAWRSRWRLSTNHQLSG